MDNVAYSENVGRILFRKGLVPFFLPFRVTKRSSLGRIVVGEVGFGVFDGSVLGKEPAGPPPAVFPLCRLLFFFF